MLGRMSHFSNKYLLNLFYGLDSGGRLPRCSPSQGKGSTTSKETPFCDECDEGSEQGGGVR